MSNSSDASCHFCGLPTPAGKGDDPVYCCYGCRFAEHITAAQGEQGANRATLARLGFAVFFSMNVIAFSMVLWVQDQEAARGEALAESMWGLLRYLSLLFSLPVVFLLGGPLTNSAVENLQSRRLTMDTLLVVGVAASFAFSVWNVFADKGHVYFEVTCAILVLVTLGKWLEAEGKRKTTEALEGLARLLPERVRILRSHGEEEIAAEEIAVGDRLRIRAGEIVPADGHIVESAASMDEQVLTGESVPVFKTVGDPIFGGTHNLDGDLVIETTTTFRGGSLQRLINQVRIAGRAKGHYERLADRVSGVFIPIVLCLAATAFVYHSFQVDLEFGIRAALGVLVISCPCALGLATPMATWAAMGTAARRQVVFQSSDALERLATIRAIRFDKTGTITTGQAKVEDACFATHEPILLERVRSRAAALADRSTHPLALAVGRFLGVFPTRSAEKLLSTRTFPGLGIEGSFEDGSDVQLGSVRFLESRGIALSDPMLHDGYENAKNRGQSVVCYSEQKSVQGVFVCAESLRAETHAAVDELRRRGFDLAILTGDHAKRGAQIERELGIPVHAELLPEDKVTSIQSTRETIGPVAMVGDGINDAPALAHSTVGIALGCGTDVSRASADVCLLSNDLLRLPWIMDLAQKTVRIIRENLIWAFSYNTLAIGFAMTGRLHPVVAAIAMLLSSFLVVGNSLRLTRVGTGAIVQRDKAEKVIEPAIQPTTLNPVRL